MKTITLYFVFYLISGALCRVIWQNNDVGTSEDEFGPYDYVSDDTAHVQDRSVGESPIDTEDIENEANFDDNLKAPIGIGQRSLDHDGSRTDNELFENDYNEEVAGTRSLESKHVRQVPENTAEMGTNTPLPPLPVVQKQKKKKNDLKTLAEQQHLSKTEVNEVAQYLAAEKAPTTPLPKKLDVLSKRKGKIQKMENLIHSLYAKMKHKINKMKSKLNITTVAPSKLVQPTTVAGPTTVDLLTTVAQSTTLNPPITVEQSTTLNPPITVAQSTTLNPPITVAQSTTLNPPITVAQSTTLNPPITVTTPSPAPLPCNLGITTTPEPAPSTAQSNRAPTPAGLPKRALSSMRQWDTDEDLEADLDDEDSRRLTRFGRIHVKSGSSPSKKSTGDKQAIGKRRNTIKSSGVTILEDMVHIKESLMVLRKFVNRIVTKVAHRTTDASNEAMADIRSNSDRISELNKTLTGKIDEIRYNISRLMTSQKVMGETGTTVMTNMISLLQRMLPMVIKKKLEAIQISDKGLSVHTQKSDTKSVLKKSKLSLTKLAEKLDKKAERERKNVPNKESLENNTPHSKRSMPTKTKAKKTTRSLDTYLQRL